MAQEIDVRTEGAGVAGGPHDAQPPERWERLLQFLPAVAFLATFGVFFVHKNSEAASVLSSGRGLLTVGVIVLGYILIGLGVRYFVPWRWVAPVVLTVVVLALAAWIVRPYYVDQTANRQLIAGPVRDATAAGDEAAAGDAERQSEPGTGSGAQAQPAPDTEPELEPDPDRPAPAPAPVRISTGTIQGAGGHDGEGTVSLIRADDGMLVVRFEDFDIENVPDPRVYLVDGPGADSPGSGVDLGRLKGNVGDVLDYAVPAGIGHEAGPGWTVLVWCRAFSVPVANATQTAT